MTNENTETTYEIRGDASGFVAATERAAQATANLTNQVKTQFDKVGKVFEEVQSKLLLITAVVGGGKFFKEAIDKANELTGSATNLSKRLGITGEEAATLRTALGDIGSDGDTYVDAFDKFAKQLKTNEQGMQDMGLKTRDANGNLRDSNTLFNEGLQTVGKYKPGLDQTTAAMTLFGKGVDDVMKLQKLNSHVLDEAREKNEALGLTLTQEGVQASKQYKMAMNDVGDVLDAVKNTIGQAVMPIFTELANYFSQSGPYVVMVFKGALTILIAAFRDLQIVVKIAAGFIFETISTLIDVGGLLGDVFSKLFHGDFSGAVSSAKDVANRIGDGFRRAFVENVDNAMTDGKNALTNDMKKLWGEGTKVGAPKGGSETMGDFDKTKDKKDKQDPSFMSFYEAALEEDKKAATERDALHGMSKEAELAFWQNILQYATLTTKDQVAVQKKASEARIALLVDEAQKADELGKVNLGAWKERGLAQVAVDEETAKNRQQLGLITQDQLLQQEMQFEQRRLEIQTAALQAELAATNPERDPVKVAQINQQLEQLEQQHQLKLQQIRGQIAVASAAQQGKIWQDLQGRMSSLWDQGVNAMMNGTLTWRNAMRAAGTQILGWFSSSVVKPMVAHWLFGEGAKTAATATGTAERGALEAAASAESIAVWAMTAVKNIMANAWAAMAAAWQAVVGIPYVGPILAVAAAAATFAGVAAIAGRVASAEGGYDIPAGVNPMTQLHEKEMVLPAKHADVIRSMADGGGRMGSMAGGAVELKATRMRGGFFMVHQDDLVAAMNAAGRNFKTG